METFREKQLGKNWRLFEKGPKETLKFPCLCFLSDTIQHSYKFFFNKISRLRRFFESITDTNRAVVFTLPKKSTGCKKTQRIPMLAWLILLSFAFLFSVAMKGSLDVSSTARQISSFISTALSPDPSALLLAGCWLWRSYTHFLTIVRARWVAFPALHGNSFSAYFIGRQFAWVLVAGQMACFGADMRAACDPAPNAATGSAAVGRDGNPPVEVSPPWGLRRARFQLTAS